MTNRQAQIKATVRARRTMDRYNIGDLQAHKAIQIADERFEGNIRLGVLWTDANERSVHVRGDRAAWNDQWARTALNKGERP